MADTEPTKTPEPSRPEQQEPEPVNKEADAEPTTEATDKPQPEPTENTEEKKPAEASADAEEDASVDKADGGEGGEAAGTTEQAAAETAANGSSSVSKKAANGKRKSTSGPGQRKLNKKKSMNRIYHLDVQPGETYLARMKSHPPWPSIVCDEEMLPPSLLNTRPVTTKRADGTYTEAYSDGGKKVNDRTFPVMFMYTNEFAWIPNVDLTPISPEDCKDVSEKNKTKNLIAAYQVAAEGHDLDYFKTMLADFERAKKEDQEEKEAKAAAKAAKQEKKKRKSMEVVDEPEDEEMEDAGEKKKSSKKRKKDLESEGEQEKPVKTPKSATKLKLTTPKAPSTGEKGGKKAASTGKSSKGKSKKKADASDEEIETPKETEKPVDPQEAKAKREKEILYLRYKLQKGFLTRDQAPEESEMELMSTYINKLEAYSDLEVSIIRSTKINKVLKAIIKLPTIPKEEEYNFRGRSVQILSKWKQLLESDIPSAGEGSTPADKPTSNGVHKKGRAGNKKAETKKGQEKKTEDADEDTAEPSKDGDISMADADDEKPETEKEERVAEEEENEKEKDEEEKEKEKEKEKEEEAGTPTKDADAMET
ncbi:PWWP domain-containing protein [Nannizzia gypsea CBS 118893]|uniref:PWWP domain-containing protein n=1 Tax=Arthroderma gypseum (strain ATCC MYA-4604 / CBS 118893) TaxID=535722 RepID=E4UYD1_ARTGP|nr:PWWP domain-containing protein [Nannizzia gypsea CBS 118893]EFR02094.1 PWWP domain-containing protein [Nannizzia gypsea CBS 118893]